MHLHGYLDMKVQTIHDKKPRIGLYQYHRNQAYY